MFQTKPTTTTTIITKPSKLNNVPVNVIVIVMTRSQVREQHVFRKHEPMKSKMTTNWQIERKMHDFFVHTIY
jgi:hypothetical protein